MPKAFLTCNVDPVDGACPEGQAAWVASTQVDPFAAPTPEHFRETFQASVAILFPIIALAFIVAWAVRAVMETVE